MATVPDDLVISRGQGEIAAAIAALVSLEEKVSAAAAAINEDDELRVYEWRPSKPPELPAIWNWIDDGSYEIVDTARADDVLVVTATIGVKPSDLAESLGRLVRLTDTFRRVVDPALAADSPPGQPRVYPLNNTVRYAKRIVTRTSIEDFDGILVMCMDMLIQLDLAAHIH